MGYFLFFFRVSFNFDHAACNMKQATPEKKFKKVFSCNMVKATLDIWSD